MQLALSSQRLKGRLAGTLVRKILVGIRNRKVSPCDVLIGSYPKSGNTWLRMLLSSLVADGPISSFDDLPRYIPELEKLRIFGGAFRLPTGGRMIKTHEQWSPRYARGVYLVRDVREVLASYYWHQLRTGQFNGSFDPFFSKFIEGGLDGYGRWEQHTQSWLSAQRAAPDQFMIVKYEDMRVSTDEVLRRVADFIGLPYTNEKIAEAVIDNSPDRMRMKEVGAKTVNRSGREDLPFVQASKDNGWEKLMTRDQVDLLLRVMEKSRKLFGYL